MNLFRNDLNKQTGSRHSYFGMVLMSLFCCGIFFACGKKDTGSPSIEDGKSTVIYDLAGDTKASVSNGVDGKEQRPFYSFLFRFRDQQQIWIRTKADSAQYLKSKDWDIAFTGTYNSEVYINYAGESTNPGYEGPATNASVIMVEQPYEEVNSAPADGVFDAMSPADSKIGWVSEGPNGWFDYDMASHIMKAFPNRTYVLRLPDGKYAKLQLMSAYKGNPPAVTDINWPAPYFTFRYFVQQDGSKNLRTR